MELCGILEAVMMICFGASWPFSILKTYRSKNPKGKSLTFLWLLEIGYLAGIASKLMMPKLEWVVAFYLLNTIMVAIDLGLTIHYLRKQKALEAAAL